MDIHNCRNNEQAKPNPTPATSNPTTMEQTKINLEQDLENGKAEAYHNAENLEKKIEARVKSEELTVVYRAGSTTTYGPAKEHRHGNDKRIHFRR